MLVIYSTWLIVLLATTTFLLFYRTSFPSSHAKHWPCDPNTRNPEAHGELIEVLAELLTLLDALVAIEPGSVSLPLTDTGCHTTGAINTTAAIAAGYSAEAVKLMYSLPYLWDWDIEIGHDTHMIGYDGMDEDGFSEERIMLYDDDNLMSPSAVQITRGQSLYGVYHIYDTEKKVVHPWNYNEYEDYREVPPLAPREAFQPLIDNFRDLNWLVRGDWYGLVTGWPWDDFPKDWPEDDRPSYEADYAVWKAVRGLKDIYIDCGWNVDTLEQNNFRRDEFLEKRKRHLEDIVAPLEDVANRVHGDLRGKRQAENTLWMSKYGHTVNPLHGIFKLECWPETSFRHW